MKMLKKAAVIITLALAGIAGTFAKDSSSEKITITATIFPQYDWTKNLIKGREKKVDLNLLISSGVDLHSYQPSAKDILSVKKSDIFIYVGGESDEWAEDILKTCDGDKPAAVNLLESLGDLAKTEVTLEGMEHHHHEEGEEHHHDDDDDDDDEDEHHHHEGEEHHHHDDEEEDELDEHVWLSLRNAEALCKAITEALCKADPEGEKTYRSNLESYAKKLRKLDEKYTKVTSEASQKTILFADRFPFRYLIDDYGLTAYAAFSGCSAETEASFKTIAFLAGKVDECKLKSVVTIENSDGKIARTVISNSKNKKASTYVLDSMQSVSQKDLKKGADYLSIMEKNLDVLKKVLK